MEPLTNLVRGSGGLGIAHQCDGASAATVKNTVWTDWPDQLVEHYDDVEVTWQSRKAGEVYTSGLVGCASLGEQPTTGARQFVDALDSPFGAWFCCKACLAFAELHCGLPPSRETFCQQTGRDSFRLVAAIPV